MINLIKNELKKIFKKKTLYVILIVTLGFCILSNILNKKFQDTNAIYNDEEKSMYEESLEYARESEDREYERQCKSFLEAAKLAEKYEKGSWQEYIISEKIQPLIEDMLRTQSDPEAYEIYKAEYDEVIKRLEANDWKIFAREELEDINSQLEAFPEDESLKAQKQVVEWRLEKDIPYGTSDLNRYLNSWVSAKMMEQEFKEKNNLSHSEKVEKEQNTETIKLCEYAIENKINSNIITRGNPDLEYSLSYSSKSLLLEAVQTYQFFIIIAVVIIAGTIISDEFNKGTIKLLLVRPYKRTKILLSKFISCIIILLLSILSVIIMQTIIGGITFGFESYKDPTLIYDFSTNTLKEVGLISYLGISTLAIMPKFILLMTLAFAISTLLLNSPMAIAIPLLGIMAEAMINQLVLTYEKAKFLIYFVTPNWDLSMYLYGALPTFEHITLPFSICICLAYFIVMIALSIYSFKKRNIKNI